jgi:hypothetical protein
MLKGTRWLGFVGMMFVLLSGTALAKGGASTTPKVHGPKTTTSTGSAAAVKASTTKGKSSSATPKTTTTSTGATTKSAKSTTPKGNSASAKTKGGATTTTQTGLTTTSNTTTSSSTGSTTGSTTGTATWTPDNPVAQKLSTKSNLMTKAQNVIGADVDLNGATSGFKNFGQFVAAVNVSNNHQIAFADLKAAMTGLDIKGQPVVTTSATGATTPASTLSLGQAMKKLTGVDSETVAQGALIQANAEINSSSTTTTSTSTSTTTTTTTTKAKSKTP